MVVIAILKLGARARRVEDQAGARARAFDPALTYPRVESPSPFLAGEVTERIWPCVGLQLRVARRPAACTRGGCGRRRLDGHRDRVGAGAHAGLDVQLGCRAASQAARLLDDRENVAYMPGVALEQGIRPKTVREIEFGGVDLVRARAVAGACPPRSARSAPAWASAARCW